MSIWQQKSKQSYWCMHQALPAFVLVEPAFAFSLLLRKDILLERSADRGLAATYHVLWTVIALQALGPVEVFSHEDSLPLRHDGK